MSDKEFREGLEWSRRHRWDPVANGIRRYARYHGITEDESRAILDRYGVLEDLSRHGFFLEYYGYKDEVESLRRIIGNRGGVSPPMAPAGGGTEWDRVLGTTEISTEVETDEDGQILKMEIRQGSCDYRIWMYPDGSVDIIDGIDSRTPMGRTAVEEFVRAWMSLNPAGSSRPSEIDDPRRSRRSYRLQDPETGARHRRRRIADMPWPP